ncbi:MAG: hypothetical protein ACOH5I_26625 [Oligoflexus sp.]
MSDWQEFWAWIDGDLKSERSSSKDSVSVEQRGFIVLELDGIELEVPASLGRIVVRAEW